jgi:hypothetical protein
LDGEASSHAGLVAERAREVGLNFQIAGRGEEKVATLAEALGVGHRIFALDDVDAVRRGLEGWTRS